MNDLNAFTGLVRRCVEDYDMIAPGDPVAVGVSGGKASLVPLLPPSQLRRYYPKPFALEALPFEPGFHGPDFTPVAEETAARGYAPAFICESAGTQAEDALAMKQCFMAQAEK